MITTNKTKTIEITTNTSKIFTVARELVVMSLTLRRGPNHLCDVGCVFAARRATVKLFGPSGTRTHTPAKVGGCKPPASASSAIGPKATQPPFTVTLKRWAGFLFRLINRRTLPLGGDFIDFLPFGEAGQRMRKLSRGGRLESL